MLRADRSAGIAQAEPGRTGVSPVKAFVIGLFLLGLLIATFIYARREQPPTAATNTTITTTTLTDEQAIAEFERLDALRLQAYESRDLRLLSSVFTFGSPELEKARNRISQLKSDDVLMKHQYDVIETQVMTSTASSLSIRQTVDIDIRFLDEVGNDITKSGSPERLTVVWVLNNVDGSWRIHSGLVKDATPL